MVFVLDMSGQLLRSFNQASSKLLPLWKCQLTRSLSTFSQTTELTAKTVTQGKRSLCWSRETRLSSPASSPVDNETDLTATEAEELVQLLNKICELQ